MTPKRCGVCVFVCVYFVRACFCVRESDPPKVCIIRFFDGYCSTVQGLLDWFEADLGFTELLFIQIGLCVLCVFVLYSPVSLSSCPFLEVIVTLSTPSVNIVSPTRTHATDKIEG